MSSISFPLSISNHHSIGRRFSAAATPPPRRRLRLSASCATAARNPRTAPPQTASLYQVLGVREVATCQEIKAAYRKMARVLHPDAASNGRGDDTSAAAEFMNLHAAYATLSDPEKRAVYDRSIFFRRQRTAASGGSELTRRWETDQCW